MTQTNRIRFFRRALAVLLLAALTSCSEALPPAPRPVEISPNRIIEGASTEITITGEHLTGRVFTDYDREAKSRLETGFSARVGNVSLRQVRVTRNGVLTATVPEGLSPGSYDLTVQDPWQREGVLPAALVVVKADALSELIAEYRFDPIGPQHVYTPFRVTIVAVDAAGAEVKGFNEAVTLDDATHSVVPKVAGFFSFGRWSGEVEVRTPGKADALVVIDRFGKVGRSNEFVVASPEPVALRYATPERSLLVGACSPKVTVSLLDVIGVETTAPQALPLTLAWSPPAGLALFRDAACTEALVNPSLTKGEGAHTFYFRGTRGGAVALTASAEGLAPATQVERLFALPPSQLGFASLPQTVRAGSCSAAVLLESRDSFGNPVPVVSTTTIVLSILGPNLELFSDASCATPLGSASLAPGKSATTLYFRGVTAGAVSLTASTAGLASATQSETITPSTAERLDFATPPQVQVVDTCSSTAALESRDKFGNRSTVAAAVPIALSASPAAGLSFFNDSQCSQAASLSLPAGGDRAAFFFKGTAIGTYSLDASSGALAKASQPAEIIPPQPDRLAFVTLAQTVTAGECSGVTTVEARDKSDTARPVSAATAVLLAADARAGMSFFADASCAGPLASALIAQGATRTTFYFRATRAGSQPITASATGFVGAVQTQTVKPGPVDRLGFGSPARSAPAGDCSQVMVVETEDRFGNAAPAQSLTVVNLSATPANGFKLYSDGTCTQETTGITIPAGTATASVSFLGIAAALVTVNASSTGFPSVSQAQTVTPRTPSKLVFTTPQQTTPAGACSSVVAVQSQDLYGNPSYVTTAANISVGASPSTALAFFSDGSCTARITSAAFRPGFDLTSFYVRGTLAGTYTITASAFGASDALEETITPASAAKFSWEPVASPRPSMLPFEVAVRARDVYDNLTPSFTGSAALAAIPSGSVACAASCSGAAQTAAFSGGLWTGTVTVGPAGSTQKLVAASGAVTGTSNPVDLVAPPARSPPLARFTASPGAVLFGKSIAFDASASLDYQTAAASLDVSWDFTGAAGGPPPWSAFTSTKTASAPFLTPGVYFPRLAVRDADGDIGYATGLVVVASVAQELCTVTTTSQSDDGALACDGPFGTDGALSLPEAVRLANAAGPRVITFGAPMSLSGPSTLTLSRAMTIVGGSNASLPSALDVSADVLVAGLGFVGAAAGSTVRAGGNLSLRHSQLRSSAGLSVAGKASLSYVRMTGCLTDCLTDEGSAELTLSFSELSGAPSRSGLLVKSCASGASPISVQSTVFERLKTGIRAECDRTLSVQHGTFAENERGVVFAGGTGHALVNSLFAGQTAEAVACGTAAFTSRRTHLLFQNGPAGCLGTDPGALNGDPLFVFPAARDLRLLPASPATDSAVDLGLDLNGPAPGSFSGAGPDRGALESN